MDSTTTIADNVDKNSTADSSVQETVASPTENEISPTDNLAPVTSLQGMLLAGFTPLPAAGIAPKGLTPVPAGTPALTSPPRKTETQTPVPVPLDGPVVNETPEGGATEAAAHTSITTSDASDSTLTAPKPSVEPSAIPAASGASGGTSQVVAPTRSRIVRPEGAEKKIASKIPVNSSASRPKTPLRARPSSAGRLQGNASMTVSNSAAPRSSIQTSSSPSGPSSNRHFLKETAAWKNKFLSPEELAKLQSDGGEVASTMAHAGITIAPSSTHHYEKSTVSSASMDEKLSERIREVRATSSGVSAGSREQTAVPRSRGSTPSRGVTPPRQRPSSAGPRSRPSVPVNPGAKPVHNRLYDAQIEMNRRKEQARERRLEQETKELTFKPTLYSTPPSNLHARGAVHAVPVSKENTPSTPGSEVVSPVRTPPVASRMVRGSATYSRTPPGPDRHPPSRGPATAPRSIHGSGVKAAPGNATDVFDRLSKLTTASLQADMKVAPAPPAFSGGSMVPEDHPSLAKMTTHPSFGAPARDTQAPSVKIKYVIPASAIPHPREHSPVKQSPKTREKSTINVSEQVPSHAIPRKSSTTAIVASTPAVPDAPNNVATAVGVSEDVTTSPVAVASTDDAAPVDAVIDPPAPPTTETITDVVQNGTDDTAHPAPDSMKPEVQYGTEESQAVKPQVSPSRVSSIPVLSGSKANNNSPTKKAAAKKAAYVTLLAEASPEVETVGPEEPEVEPTESNTDGVMAALSRQGSSGNAPIGVTLGSIGGVAGMASSKHVQRLKKGLPKRRLSGTALSVDELNTALNEGGGGDVDRGYRERQDSIKEEDVVAAEAEQPVVSETVNNKNNNEFPEIRDSESRTLDRAGSIDELSKEAVDRMLEGFSGLGDDLESST